MLKQYRRAAAKTCILFPKEKLSCSCFVPAVVDFVFFGCVCVDLCSAPLHHVESVSCLCGVAFWRGLKLHLLLPCRAAASFVPCGFMLWCHVVSCSGVMWSCMSFMSCEVAFFMGSCLLHHVMWSFRLLHVMWSFRLPCVTWSCHLPVVELLPSPCLELPPSSCGVAAFFMSCGVTIFSAPCPVESLSVLSSS